MKKQLIAISLLASIAAFGSAQACCKTKFERVKPHVAASASQKAKKTQSRVKPAEFRKRNKRRLGSRQGQSARQLDKSTPKLQEAVANGK